MAPKGQVRQNPSMNLIKPLFTLSFSIALYAQTPTVIDLRGAQVMMEYTGQVTNAGTGSIQVGYLNYVKGFNAVFSAGSDSRRIDSAIYLLHQRNHDPQRVKRHDAGRYPRRNHHRISCQRAGRLYQSGFLSLRNSNTGFVVASAGADRHGHQRLYGLEL